MTVEPIGFFHGGAVRKYEAPRQGVFAGYTGTVELIGGHNFETALRDLDGFERLWLIFAFDRNGAAWRPTVRPPVTAPGSPRVGLFASRAPYRPNPLGLSCVRLVAIRGRTLDVDEADLLDGTPILDIKPYVPAADAFPDARAGWVTAQCHWQVVATPAFEAAAACVRAAGGQDLLATATRQLAGDPFDAARKRVAQTSATTGIFSVRMFRIHFSVDATTHTVTLVALQSGYTSAELAAPEDPYEDKFFHRALAAVATTRTQPNVLY